MTKLLPTTPDPPTMDLPRLQATSKEFFTPRFTVTVGDQEFSEGSGLISDVSVDTTVDGASEFGFTANPPFDHASGEFGPIDTATGSVPSVTSPRGGGEPLFRAGRPVGIAAGYGDNQPTLVTGTIQSVQPNFPASGGPTVSVRGYDGLHALSTGRSDTTSWDSKTIAEVIEQVVATPGFRETEIEENRGTTMTYAKIERRPEVGTLEFVRELARRVGFEVFVVPLETGERFYFRSPGFDSEPVVRVRYGESLRSFSPEVNAAGQIESVSVHGYDAARREPITGTAENPGSGDVAERPRGSVTLRLPVRSQEEAEVRAAAELDRRRDDLLRGRGETLGTPVIRAGETVHLDGLGEPYSGVYYVESATHRIGTGGYTTSFDVKRRVA